MTTNEDRFYVWPYEEGFQVKDEQENRRVIATCPTAADAANVAFALNHTTRNK